MSNADSDVFQVFRSMGASEDGAMRAATALSRRDGDVSGMSAKLDRVMDDVASMKPEIAALKADMVAVKWGIGVLVPLVIALVFKAFLPISH
jgi:hypothetical protein